MYPSTSWGSLLQPICHSFTKWPITISLLFYSFILKNQLITETMEEESMNTSCLNPSCLYCLHHLHMDNAVKFCWQIAKDPNLLNHISCIIFIQLLSRTRRNLGSLSGFSPVMSSSEDPLSFVPIQSWPLLNGINLLNNYKLSYSMCLDCNIVLIFLSKLYFPHLLVFLLQTYIGIINNNHARDSIFYNLEISSSKEIDSLPLIFPQASYKNMSIRKPDYYSKNYKYKFILIFKILLHSENFWFRSVQSVMFSALHCSRSYYILSWSLISPSIIFCIVILFEVPKTCLFLLNTT